jgi:hypothetical protein
MIYRRAAAIVLVISCLAWRAVAQAANDPLDQISAYEGTWHGHTTYYATKFSKARTDDSTVHNDCWRSGDYFACHQIVNGVPAAFIVYTYDQTQQFYHIHVVPNDSSDSPASKLLIDGNTWTFPWQGKDGDKTLYFRVVNVFTDPKTIQYRQEYSYDNVNWVKTGDGVEHRDP